MLSESTSINWWPLSTTLTHWPLGDVAVILKVWFSKSLQRIVAWAVTVWLPQELINEKSILVQVMTWCCQQMSHYLSQCWPRSMPTYGITRLQSGKGKRKHNGQGDHYINSSPPSAAYMPRRTGSALVQVMAWRRTGGKPLPEPMLIYCQLDP